jgi:CHAT domain-containing protein
LLREAGERLEGLGFAGDATFVHAMEAGNARALGRTDEAWRQDLEVFARLDAIPDPRRTQALLAEAARITEMEGRSSAALVLQQASLQYAERHDTPYDRCEGQVWLARMAARAGEDALAAGAVEAAERLRVKVEDPSARERLAAELELSRAHLALTTDPREAARAATEGLEFYRLRGEPPRVVEALLLRGRAHQALGNVMAAEGDYLDALEAVEAQREIIADPYLRISFSESSFELARALVQLQWARGQSETALLLANRFRARTLRESRAAAPALSNVHELRKTLGPAEAVLFYAVLPDRALVWAIARERVESAEIASSEWDLERRIEAWRSATVSRDLARSIAAAKDLHRLLLTPVLPVLEGVHTVGIVPDGPLHRLSWMALRDARTGRAWVEDTRVAVLPYLSPSPARDPLSRPAAAAVVGDPSFDRSLYPGLPDLPGALAEAQRVASLYTRPTLLLAGDATRERVLQAAEGADVLHVAGHGLADAFDAESSSLPLADGALLPRDIRRRNLGKLQLVVLAACRSGDGPPSRAEGPLSLARPFLEAGARAVLVSLFELPDRQTTTAEVHRHLLEGVGAVEAVRRTVAECWNAPRPDALTCGGLQLVLDGGDP